MIPRVRIAHLPTPVEALPRLSAVLGGPRLLVKRDDQTGVAFGGNKTRKLEYVIAEAQANGAKTLVTMGGIQSNHCRQTAALARRFGFDCILVLNGQEPEMPSGNLLVDHLFGAEIVWTKRPERNQTFERTFEQAWEAGRRPYKIPMGASNATGALGYVEAMDELVNQGVEADWIIVPSSSCGTLSGMLLGAKLKGFKGKILAVSIDVPVDEMRETTAAMASEASTRFGEKITFRPEEVLVNADYLGAGYAVMGESEKEAIELFAQAEGMLLGPVYTGRAAGGMIDLIRKKFFKPDETVLFWHTGGTPELFADPYAAQLLGKRPLGPAAGQETRK